MHSGPTFSFRIMCILFVELWGNSFCACIVRILYIIQSWMTRKWQLRLSEQCACHSMPGVIISCNVRASLVETHVWRHQGMWRHDGGMMGNVGGRMLIYAWRQLVSLAYGSLIGHLISNGSFIPNPICCSPYTKTRKIDRTKHSSKRTL